MNNWENLPVNMNCSSIRISLSRSHSRRCLRVMPGYHFLFPEKLVSLYVEEHRDSFVFKDILHCFVVNAVSDQNVFVNFVKEFFFAQRNKLQGAKVLSFHLSGKRIPRLSLSLCMCMSLLVGLFFSLLSRVLFQYYGLLPMICSAAVVAAETILYGRVSITKLKWYMTRRPP